MVEKKRNEMFEQCFEDVKEGLEKARSNDSGAFFLGMYLYLAQELPKILEKLSTTEQLFSRIKRSTLGKVL